jgi:hypothetical protein
MKSPAGLMKPGAPTWRAPKGIVSMLATLCRRIVRACRFLPSDTRIASPHGPQAGRGGDRFGILSLLGGRFRTCHDGFVPGTAAYTLPGSSGREAGGFTVPVSIPIKDHRTERFSGWQVLENVSISSPVGTITGSSRPQLSPCWGRCFMIRERPSSEGGPFSGLGSNLMMNRSPLQSSMGRPFTSGWACLMAAVSLGQTMA